MKSKPVLTDADRALYPTHLLEGCETGLCLFAAAFLGLNDAAHFEEAGVRTTCVDTDEDRLGQMSFYYPKDWQFYADDAWRFAEGHRGARYDAVSVDPFTGSMAQDVLESWELWASLARRFVTITIPAYGWNSPSVGGAGWKATTLHRSGIASWLVLERA